MTTVLAILVFGFLFLLSMALPMLFVVLLYFWWRSPGSAGLDVPPIRPNAHSGGRSLAAGLLTRPRASVHAP